jgi:sRNA-binding carbon storage regulator CsrA
MLILSREVGQVQLAIEAPDDVEILRKETWDRLHGP